MPKNKISEPNDPPLVPSTIERVVDIYKQDLKFKTEELSLHRKREENQKEIAEKAITANLEEIPSLLSQPFIFIFFYAFLLYFFRSPI